MIYLKWKLSDGTSGTGPESVIADRGGLAEASWAVDAAGYRIAEVLPDGRISSPPPPDDE